MPNQLEPASSGRARCRACKLPISKGELRLGVAVPNPFGEGDAVHWYHLECGAWREPEAYLQTLAALPSDALRPPVALESRLEQRAVVSQTYPRLRRFSRVERAKSARAHCRHCRDVIAQGELRFCLEMVTDGVANATGFLHLGCARAYAGSVEYILEEIERPGPLLPLDRQALREALG